MYYSPGLIVEVVGVALVMLAWWLFRKPGVAFLTFGPIWRASKYVEPAGVALWVLGLLVALVGVVMHFTRVGV